LYLDGTVIVRTKPKARLKEMHFARVQKHQNQTKNQSVILAWRERG